MWRIDKAFLTEIVFQNSPDQEGNFLFNCVEFGKVSKITVDRERRILD